MKAFDLIRTPLDKGTLLLEASAGTGKTYAIAGMYLRLLLECELGLDKILVVTFTEAATSELRDRIRDRLIEARRSLREGGSKDPLTQHLVASVAASAEKRGAWESRLQTALETLDEAAIFTIHGFCHRVLRERAFDSGVLFDAELATDMGPIMDEALHNVWRRGVYAMPTRRLTMMLSAEGSLLELRDLQHWLRRHPDARLLMDDEGRDVKESGEELDEALEMVAKIWASDRLEIMSHFGDEAKWCNRPYNASAQMEPIWEDVERLLGQGPFSVKQVESLGKFTPSALEEKKKKRGAAAVPQHRFFEGCATVLRCLQIYSSVLRRSLLEEADIELRRLMERDRCLGFDDLLLGLRAALSDPESGARFVDVLRRRYAAVLIDEFQDTDPVQYEIFHQLFGDGETRLHLVGDPKQAIYSFRGADIFAYLKARNEVDASRVLTLDTNWRSESGVVHAVNALFDWKSSFVLEEVDFHKVKPQGRAEATPLLENGTRAGGLHVWRLEVEDGALGVRSELRWVADAVASEIVRLLSGSVTLGDRMLRPGDIAVLVETHVQAAAVQAALGRRRVPSVQHARESVFMSEEATELFQVLSALVNLSHSGWVRGALGTRLMGLTAADLDLLARDEAAWEQTWERLDGYREEWMRQGFLAMWRHLMRRERVVTRMLRWVDGERRLTNYLHIVELLHQESVRRQLGPAALVDWLGGCRVDEGESSDDTLIRLESDEDSVQLVTLHRSKGLEYGVVFCPYLQRSPRLSRNGRVLFHDPKADNALVCDLRSEVDPEHKSRAEMEMFAENVRLAYVALTRAKHRGYVLWGTLSKVDTAALSWLLVGVPKVAVDSPLEFINALEGIMGGIEADARGSSLETWMARATSCAAEMDPASDSPRLKIMDMPAPDARVWGGNVSKMMAGKPRTFEGTIQRTWTAASFSSLIRFNSATPDAPTASVSAPVSETTLAATTTVDPGEERAGGWDEQSTGAVTREESGAGAVETGAGEEMKSGRTERRGLAAQFRGTRAGLCLHEILERIDFQAEADTRRKLITDRLRAHRHLNTPVRVMVETWVERALGMELIPGLRLSDVQVQDRLVELEFHLPLGKVTAAALRSAFSESDRWGDFGKAEGRGVGVHWNFPGLDGLLKGYVDLVFRNGGLYYLLDWKTNDLGEEPGAYGSEALRDYIVQSEYILQYHLYTVALEQYLRHRCIDHDYETRFGGVLYVFLRGLDPERPGQGVYFEKPDVRLIDSLRSVIVAGAPTDVGAFENVNETAKGGGL